MAFNVTVRKNDPIMPIEQLEMDTASCLQRFGTWQDNEQTRFVQKLLLRMCPSQHSSINAVLKPILQRDFISLLPMVGLDYLAEEILSYLDIGSLCSAELVCQDWYIIVSESKAWKKIIETKVKTNRLWKVLAEKRSMIQFLFKPKPGERHPDNTFYKSLLIKMFQDIECIETNWKTARYNLKRIKCRSENSKGVYCLQFDDDKIVAGLRDNSIKIWNKNTLECISVLTGHTGSVLCLQFDDKVIISGSSDSTVRVWNIHTGELLNTIIHHSEAVLHVRFNDGRMVTCSKDRTVAVWNYISPSNITLKKVLIGHRAAVNVVDFDEKYIVSASGDRTIKVWNASDGAFIRTLNGHRRGIACLQFRGNLIITGSSDKTVRLWDIKSGACLRVLEGHQDLVRCVRFDNRYIVTGAYDGEIKVWDLNAALNPRSPTSNLCLSTLLEHTGRVFRLQFDDFHLVSSSHDDTILIWDFLDLMAPESTTTSDIAARLGMVPSHNA